MSFSLTSTARRTTGSGRDAILAVFLKVLNELQGYSGDYPHIAHLERYLEGKGKLAQFHEVFREATGAEWITERDAYDFNRDEVVTRLSKTLRQSQESAEKWIDGAEGSFALTVENFCKWVKEYLDAKGRSTAYFPGGRSGAIHRHRLASNAELADDHRGTRHDLQGPSMARRHLTGRYRCRTRGDEKNQGE